MMNVYNGEATTDAEGNATVELPGYFEALTRDFRYQLTVVGQFAQAMVAQEIRDNRFAIKTDKPDVRVSWQVTGIRQDAWANAHRAEAEVHKPEDERGRYLAPGGHGRPAEAGTYYVAPPASEGSAEIDDRSASSSRGQAAAGPLLTLSGRASRSGSDRARSVARAGRPAPPLKSATWPWLTEGASRGEVLRARSRWFSPCLSSGGVRMLRAAHASGEGREKS